MQIVSNNIAETFRHLYDNIFLLPHSTINYVVGVGRVLRWGRHTTKRRGGWPVGRLPAAGVRVLWQRRWIEKLAIWPEQWPL